MTKETHLFIRLNSPWQSYHRT